MAAYPGVSRAHDFVVPSYGWMLRRAGAADARLQSFQMFAGTVTFGVPAAVKVLNPSIDLTNGRLILAVIAFGAVMVIGVFAQMKTEVMLADPGRFYASWLHMTDWEFKKNAVFFAGQHLEFNRNVIKGKSRAAAWMT